MAGWILSLRICQKKGRKRQKRKRKKKRKCYIHILHGWFMLLCGYCFFEHGNKDPGGMMDVITFHWICITHMFVRPTGWKIYLSTGSEAKPEAWMGSLDHARMATYMADTRAKSVQTSSNRQTNGEISSGHLERKIDNLSTKGTNGLSSVSAEHTQAKTSGKKKKKDCAV